MILLGSSWVVELQPTLTVIKYINNKFYFFKEGSPQDDTTTTLDTYWFRQTPAKPPR